MDVGKLGLLEENSFLVAYIPASNKALVYRVKAIVNKGYPIINYGPLPLPSGTPLSTYDGGSTTVPADGILPARAFTPTGISFPWTGAYDPSDMWYLPDSYRERIFHVIQYITPDFVRVDAEIPKGVNQGRFQRDKISTGVFYNFGFSRGKIEMIHIPEIRYGYRYGNDTNMDLYTFVRFVYGEYLIEIPTDPELIWNILQRKIPSKWVSLPINVYDDSIRRALTKDYGIEGFTLYPVNKKPEAISEYSSVVKDIKEEVV